jgi:pimeloyl-ACP methyl ester carboxylesterase
MKKYIFCALLLVLLFALSTEVRASTLVETDTLSEDAEWTKEGSPYILAGNSFAIPEGVTLTVAPGVVVTGSSTNIMVYGSLIAEGTEEEKVFFDRIGIRIIGGANSHLNQVSLKHSDEGIYYEDTNGRVWNIHIEDSRKGFTAYRGGIDVEGVTASNVDAFLSVYQGSANLSMCDISEGGNGNVMELTEASLTVSGCSISNIKDDFAAIKLNKSAARLDGILLESDSKGTALFADQYSGFTITNSNINNFEIGVDTTFEDSKIFDTSITNNKIGIKINNDKFPEDKGTGGEPDVFERTIIKNNSEYGIKNDSDFIINATNNLWGDASGPYHLGSNPGGKGNQVSDLVLFTPWDRREEAVAPLCCSNVIFLPGFMGSRMHKDSNQLWEPNRNADVEKMYLDEHGVSIDPEIQVGEIIDKTNVAGPFFSKKIYQGLGNRMNELVESGRINSWKALPYDWRLGSEEILKDGNIISEIEQAAASSQTGKVTLVAHSYGGLVAQSLIEKLEAKGEEELIDSLVLVAVPQLGTPQAIPSLLHGDDMRLLGGFILSKKNAREWGENMPAPYHLLPSSEYLDTVQAAPIVFDSSLDAINSWRDIYGESIFTSEELEKFLLGKEGRADPGYGNVDWPNILNSELLDRGQEFHDESKNHIATSTRVFQVAGWGASTPSGIKYFATAHGALDHEDIDTFDGDGTVVTPSAVGRETFFLHTYFVDLKQLNSNQYRNFQHADILETDPALDLVTNIVLGSSTESVEYVSNVKPNSRPFTNLAISIHSPVALHAYDMQGGHTGAIANPDPSSDLVLFEEKIPNSSYKEVGEGKYLTLQDAQNPIVKLQGTAIGSFTLKTIETKDDKVIKTVFTDIPVTDTMKGELKLATQNASSSLALDVNGDSKTDFLIKPNAHPDPILYLTIFKQAIASFGLNPLAEKMIVNRIDKVLKSLTKEKIKAAEKKLVKFKTKLDEKEWKVKKINETDRVQLIKIINELLDTF